MKAVLKEIEQSGDKIILFLDEIHVMVGAGGSDGAIDASNILKPSLARGTLRCIGATTTMEYMKSVEKDVALARRFQSVYVTEPTPSETIQIVKALKNKYEMHHKIFISDAAINAAISLSERYYPSKKFPDKAIDLIDEAASRLRSKLETKPSALLVAENELLKLVRFSKSGDSAHAFEEEDSYVSNGYSDGNHSGSSGTLRSQYPSQEQTPLMGDAGRGARLQATVAKYTYEWRRSIELTRSIFETLSDMRTVRKEYAAALHSSSDDDKTDHSSNGNCNGGTATAVSDSAGSNTANERRIEMQERLVQMKLINDQRCKELLSLGVEDGASSNNDSSSGISSSPYDNTLTARDIAVVVSESTGISISEMVGNSEKQKVLRLETELRARLVGQDEAIATIARCVQVSSAGLRHHDRPLGVFLMLGSTVSSNSAV